MDYIKGPTPNGGVYAHVYFLDNNGNLSDKKNGTNGRILEFDENNKIIKETYFIINGKYLPSDNHRLKKNNNKE